MNLEGIALHSLTRFLEEKVAGGKIYKIAMPEPHAIVLSVRRERDAAHILIDAGGESPSIRLVEKTPPNPAEPPAFCMLLRKHLEEGRITDIRQKALDRIITFEISLLGKSSKIITLELIIELTGRNSNIIFVKDGMIIDSLKHISPVMNSYRTVQPGAVYTGPPEQEGLNILETDPAEIVDSIPEMSNKKILNHCYGLTTGIGKATAEQLLTGASIPLNATFLAPADREHLKNSLEKLQEDVKKSEVFTALISATNRCKTIFPFAAPYVEKGCTLKEFSSINDALNYACSLEPVKLPLKLTLAKTVHSEITRQLKKTEALKKDIEEAANADDYRIIADSLMASLYNIKQGQTECRIFNVYDNSELTVKLSPVHSPAENAQRYYKKYNKLKRAAIVVQEQLTKTLELINYLEGIETGLKYISTKEESEEVREELIKLGLIRPSKKKRPHVGKSRPLHIAFSENTSIYIGKNNRQNDMVTFKLGKDKDFWFHTRNIPGSHVLLKTDLPEAEPEAFQTALELAAYFSKASGGNNIPVDATLKRYVKKPAGAKPGFVIFTGETTYYITPDEEKCMKLIKNNSR